MSKDKINNIVMNENKIIKNTIKEVKYKNIIWFKNKGAQDHCLSIIKDNQQLVCIDNKNQGRLYGNITVDQLLKLINKNIGLYEIIHRYPYKVYFDIDGDTTCNIKNIKDLILKYFINANLSISGYISEDKISYHIVLDNYIINNEAERLYLKRIVSYLNTLDSSFDKAVYSKNRLMKCINQSKRNKPVQEILDDKSNEDHLITCFIKPSTLSILDVEIEEDINELKVIEWSIIPKIKIKLPENFKNNKDLQPIDYLNITPFGSEYGHPYTWRVALFAYHNKISFDDFISWYSQKSTDEININKWSNHWAKLNMFDKIDISKYKIFLSNFYPDLIQSNNNKFIELFNYPCKTIKYINSLSQADFNFNDAKCKIINIGMGGGKTTQTINYLAANKEDAFIWITPNISLAMGTKGRISDMNINCNLYNTAKNKTDKRYLIENSKNIIICLNSIHYTSKFYDTVIIDEIETFLKLFNCNSTLNSTKAGISLDNTWDKFINILLNCKKIILLDAFISKITLDFLDKLKINYEIIRRSNETSERKMIIKKSFNSWACNIIKDLKAGKKIIIFYPLKKERKSNDLMVYPSMQQLVNQISSMTGKKGIFHNADCGAKINNKLKDVNKYWIEYDFVVSNNKINVGLNFDLKFFNSCYLALAGFSSPRDIIQFSYRARSLSDDTIKYCFLDHSNNINGQEKEKVNNYNDVFRKLNKNIRIEKYANLKKTFLFFATAAKYNIDNEIIMDDIEPVKFIDCDYYNYNKIDDYEKKLIKQIERDIYAQKATTDLILSVQKFHFKKLFKPDTDHKVMANLWNYNKLSLIKNISKILSKDKILEKLKDNYNWKCYYPDSVHKNFRFNNEDLKMILDNYNFKTNRAKMNHRVILKSYINTVYGTQVIKSKKINSRSEFSICEKFAQYYIEISENIKIYKEAEIFIDDQIDEEAPPAPPSIKRINQKNGLFSINE